MFYLILNVVYNIVLFVTKIVPWSFKDYMERVCIFVFMFWMTICKFQLTGIFGLKPVLLLVIREM